MDSNIQSRKWLLTINNPQNSNLGHSEIIRIASLSNPDYMCLVDERATTGTLHTHLFIYSHSPIRFSTLKNRFPTAHIDKANGSVMENRDYLRKEGKWEGSDKEKTNLLDTFEEFGEIPKPCNESNPDMAELLEEIENGYSTYEIIMKHPKFGFKGKDIDYIRQTILDNKYKEIKRNVVTTYICGKSGTGKTRSIYAKHKASDICRITSYRKGNPALFDGYNGQPVLVFEEFAGQVPIEEMLNYLDIYPLLLPARYNDKVACYKTVYITSNIPLDMQYPDVQTVKPETWNAFLRRINYVEEYTDYGVFTRRVLNKPEEINND